jgi:hypothetical protein
MAGALTHALGRAAAAGGGSAYYGTAEDLTGAAVSNTTYADKLSTSPTLVNGRTYLLVWTADVVFGVNGSLVRAQLTVNGASQGEQTVQAARTGSPYDRLQVGGFAFHTAGASAVPFAIQAKVVSSSHTFSNYRITWLALDASHDYTQVSLTRQTTTSSSLQTAATLTFSDTGNYVVLVSFELDASTTTAQFQISDGTVTIGTSTITPESAPSYAFPVVAMLDIGSVSGSKSITVKYRSDGVNTVGITNVRILAIRLNRYAYSYKTTLSADNGGTNSSYTAALTQTFTPASGPHLALAAWGMAGDTGSAQFNYGRFSDGGTITDESIAVARSSVTANRWMSAFGHQQATYAASSRTQSIDRHRDTTNTVYIEAKAMILTLDLTGIS